MCVCVCGGGGEETGIWEENGFREENDFWLEMGVLGTFSGENPGLSESGSLEESVLKEKELWEEGRLLGGTSFLEETRSLG